MREIGEEVYIVFFLYINFAYTPNNPLPRTLGHGLLFRDFRGGGGYRCGGTAAWWIAEGAKRTPKNVEIGKLGHPRNGKITIFALA